MTTTSMEAIPASTLHSMSLTLDSAVSAFSNTFSRTPTGQRRNLNTSSNLPVELLIIIFCLVYDDVYVYSPWDPNYMESNRFSPSLFPYALASVCSLWRDAMSLVPKFWSRLVFLVDSPATPLPAVLSQLSWSRHNRLDIIVTRKNLNDGLDRDYEKAQIASMMNIFVSHIYRIRELRFDVMFSSSLPSFPADFHGAATALKRLELRCQEDDGSSDRIDLSVPEHAQLLRFPRLVWLVIDGRNYYDFFRQDARWTEKIPSIADWTISHFKPRPEESLSSGELLLSLPVTQIHTLTLVDVVLDPSPQEFEFPGLAIMESLVFEDMHDFRIMDQIIHWMNPYVISFIRCTFGCIADVPGHFGHPNGGELVLEEIDQDMTPLLRVWHAHYLNVVRCPDFSDITLDAMSAEEDETVACAAYLRTLSITNCSNFSIAALRRFIESRLHLPPDNVDQSDPVMIPVQSLYLSGNILSISEEDRAWFEANVPVFEVD